VLRVFVLTMLLALAPVPARAADAEPPPRVGFGLALGLHPSPDNLCEGGGDLVLCSRWLPAWAMRLHVSYALAPGWSVALVGGAGTDLDARESFFSSSGSQTDVRRFVDLALLGRYLFGEGAGPGWIGAEAGLMVAVDSVTDLDPQGHEVDTVSASQHAPLVGVRGGVVLLRHRHFSLDLEAGVRLTPFGTNPREFLVTRFGQRQATDYGTRTWLWLGLGGRYGN
jgi:hypothetical protein